MFYAAVCTTWLYNNEYNCIFLEIVKWVRMIGSHPNWRSKSDERPPCWSHTKSETTDLDRPTLTSIASHKMKNSTLFSGQNQTQALLAGPIPSGWRETLIRAMILQKKIMYLNLSNPLLKSNNALYWRILNQNQSFCRRLTTWGTWSQPRLQSTRQTRRSSMTASDRWSGFDDARPSHPWTT